MINPLSNNYNINAVIAQILVKKLNFRYLEVLLCWSMVVIYCCSLAKCWLGLPANSLSACNSVRQLYTALHVIIWLSLLSLSSPVYQRVCNLILMINIFLNDDLVVSSQLVEWA